MKYKKMLEIQTKKTKTIFYILTMGHNIEILVNIDNRKYDSTAN